MIQTVAAPSAPVQREDRGASQPRGHMPPGDLLVLATEILSLVVTQPILPTHLPHLKRLMGAFYVRKHKTLLRRKDFGT